MSDVPADTTTRRGELRDLPSAIVRILLKARPRQRIPERPITLHPILESVRAPIRQPIFIVGAPRSGTTYLGRGIGALPEAAYFHVPVATKKTNRFAYNRQWPLIVARGYYCQAYSNLLGAPQQGDRRFAKKTPRNCFLIEFLAAIFPDASLVHIIRDGRDVALSYSRKP